jgi:hypothetical protein
MRPQIVTRTVEPEAEGGRPVEPVKCGEAIADALCIALCEEGRGQEEREEKTHDAVMPDPRCEGNPPAQSTKTNSFV